MSRTGTSVASFRDVAYQELRRALTNLEIPPGAAFTESQIAERLSLSKTPVREALTRLKYEGLVLVGPRSGYRASPVTLGDTRDFFTARLLLEAKTAQLAAGREVKVEHLRELDRLSEISYDPTDSGSIDEFLAANTKFHIIISRVAGNDRLTGMLEVLLIQMERLFRLGLRLKARGETMASEHRDLLEAIIAGDPGRAGRLTEEQVHRSQAMVIEALMSSPDVLTMPISVHDGKSTITTKAT